MRRPAILSTDAIPAILLELPAILAVGNHKTETSGYSKPHGVCREGLARRIATCVKCYSIARIHLQAASDFTQNGGSLASQEQ